MKKHFLLIGLLAALIAAPPSMAEEKKGSGKPAAAEKKSSSSSSAGSMAAKVNPRADRKLGVIVSLLGDPVPVLWGINIAYNIFDFLRARVGYGQAYVPYGIALVSTSSIGLGAQAFVPGWKFSPTVGLSWSSFSVDTASIGGQTIDVSGFSSALSHAYLNLGFDYQAPKGFHFGIGANYAPIVATFIPYISIGAFF